MEETKSNKITRWVDKETAEEKANKYKVLVLMQESILGLEDIRNRVLKAVEHMFDNGYKVSDEIKKEYIEKGKKAYVYLRDVHRYPLSEVIGMMEEAEIVVFISNTYAKNYDNDRKYQILNKVMTDYYVYRPIVEIGLVDIISMTGFEVKRVG